MLASKTELLFGACLSWTYASSTLESVTLPCVYQSTLLCWSNYVATTPSVFSLVIQQALTLVFKGESCWFQVERRRHKTFFYFERCFVKEVHPLKLFVEQTILFLDLHAGPTHCLVASWLVHFSMECCSVLLRLDCYRDDNCQQQDLARHWHWSLLCWSDLHASSQEALQVQIN